MNDDAPATEKVNGTPVEAPARKPRAPKAQKYVVQKAAIAPYGGARADLIRPGEVVELTADLAKHYNKLGFLAPYIED